MELRNPYVGTGIEGALRSAEIDQTEADTYPARSEQRERALDSARRWRLQAGWLIAEKNASSAQGGGTT
jgi:hypothetical protein